MRRGLIAALTVTSALVLPALPATAVQSPHTLIVNDASSALTPEIKDGRVLTIAKVGSKVILGGTFTMVSDRGSGTVLSRPNILAFDAVSGAVDTAFAPSINGVVNTLLPGPNNTVYAGGTFTSVNGATQRNLTYLNAATGAVVTGFKAAALNGAVNDLALSGGRLFVGGTFNTAGGVGHGGLVTLAPSNGALDPYMTIDVAVNHNYPNGNARASVGVSKLDITPDGGRLVAIGNFKLVEGQSRDQAVIILLPPSGPVVDPNWRTTRYEPACFSNAFDSYIRDIDIAPDGSWFSIVATGGPNPGTLCDTAARWEFSDTGADVQPRWIADTGGDTLFSVAITGPAVYVGGHQRWLNNAGGRDYAAPGSVPRPGLAALDPLNGVPLSWNPGRNPRGVGAQALLATPDGLYVGSDTDYIGSFQYFRPKIAFFPLAGGTTPVSQDTGTLPANVFLAGRPSATGSGGGAGVLFRVNTGGPAVPASDGGPTWAEDSGGNPSPYHNSGNNDAGYPPVSGVDASVPAGTPSEIFDAERWDPGTKGDGGEMTWSFPVPSGKTVDVRLYFANRYSGTSNPGQRVFDVALEGATVLDNYDIRAQTPDQTGTMRSFTVTSDGSIDLTWGHEVENPLVNGIEIVDPSVTPPPDPGPIGVDDVAKSYYTGTTVSPTEVLPPAGIQWSRARGGFMANGKLVYGLDDNNLYTRTFDGTSFGPAVLVDPYNDPFWSDKNTGSGQTYRGVKPSFYGELSSVTGMFYAGGRVYYTRSGQQGMFSRGMSLDSLIVAPQEQAVSGTTGWADAQGMFLSGANLYWASRVDGNLRRVDFTNGAPSGASTVVSGPTVDGTDWRTRVMFLGPGGPPPPNQPPSASFTSACTGLTCSFDASTSADPDGSIVGYSWTFGDSSTGSGVSPSHTYGTAGARTVTLTVTDNQGATGAVSAQVVAGQTNIAPTADFSGRCDGLSCSFDGSTSSDPDGTVTGYAWDFGDGATGTGPTPPHAYAAAGSYSVSLVVTDNNGATGSTSNTQSVTANRTITFRGAATPFTGTGVNSAALTVPGSIQAGDALVLALTTNSSVSGADPAGYTLVGTQTSGNAVTTQVWQRVATAADAGSTVTVSLSGRAKVSLSLIGYAGTRASTPVLSFAGDAEVGGSSHTTPTATAPDGAMVVSVWNDKSATARQFTAPNGVSVRTAVPGDGKGDIATLVVDGGAPVAAGPVGGLTATVDSPSSRSTMLTLVLAAGS